MVSSNNTLYIDCRSVKIESHLAAEEQQLDDRDQTQRAEEPEPQFPRT